MLTVTWDTSNGPENGVLKLRIEGCKELESMPAELSDKLIAFVLRREAERIERGPPKSFKQVVVRGK